MITKSTSCPFIGLKDDASTTLNFPSPGNHCHHAQPIAPVQIDHQSRFCLTSGHVNCPVYQAAHPVPLPVDLAAPVEQPRNWRKTLTVAGIPVLIAAAAFLLTPWSGLGARLFDRSGIPNTGANNTLRWAVINSSQEAPTVAQDAVEAQPPALVNCPMPVGWAPYRVQPTDSLYRLSVVYGVSLAELQSVNCFGSETAILPGQTIYLPIFQTKTPLPTSTATQVPVQQIVVDPPSSSGSDQEEKPASPPTTAPTAPPPPTVAPTEPKRNPDPPKQETKPPKPPKNEDKGGKPDKGGKEDKGGKKDKGGGKGKGKGG